MVRLTALVVLVLSHLCCTTTMRFCLYPGAKLVGYQLDAATVDSRTSCALLCLFKQHCQSVNFRTSDSYCYLVHKLRQLTHPDKLEPDPLFEYWGEDNCPGWTLPDGALNYSACAGNYTTLARCIYILPNPVTWNAAKTACRALGEHWDIISFVPPGQSVIDDIQPLIPQGTEYWIGLYAIGLNAWKWVDGDVAYRKNDFQKFVIGANPSTDTTVRGTVENPGGTARMQMFFRRVHTESTQGICFKTDTI